MTVEIVSVGAWAAFDRILALDGEADDGATVSVLSHPPHEEVFFGDCSINVAAAAAALGAGAALATVVGDDFETSGYREHLETLGVDLRGVAIHPGATSGWNLNISTPGGSSFCISHRDASRFQDSYSVPGELVTEARWVVVSESFGRYTLDAARLAHRAGVPVALNGMVGSAGPLATEFLDIAALLVINRAEMDALAEMVGADHGPSRRVITEGPRGAQVIDGERQWHTQAVAPRRVADPTGAGDAFTAATVVGLSSGLALPEAARLGSSAASFVVEEVGCQTNLPTRRALEERLEGRL
ncbi:MAG: PfkB family carbohydrate kinase [bacterium]|nr:PfkB family carbohydrate kinase [bacterium]MDE0600923.1 PfkB family carbohydrate kinase [bacterium]